MQTPFPRRERDTRRKRPYDGGYLPEDEDVTNPFVKWVESVDILAFTMIRWDFVPTRLHRLFACAAREQRVFVVEEPLRVETDRPVFDVVERAERLWVVSAKVPRTWESSEVERWMAGQLVVLRQTHALQRFVLWVTAPLALPYADQLEPWLVVYDCSDDPSRFLSAPSLLAQREAQLLSCADVVFTAGNSLFEAKKTQHPFVHAFPEGCDYDRFVAARSPRALPQELAAIPGPRFGFCGAIDERVDFELLWSVATLRPQWHLVLVGPVLPRLALELPRCPNIHYLGAQPYERWPDLLAHCEVALLPYQVHSATRYLAPAAMADALAAGRPVVATALEAVVPYGKRGLVSVAYDTREFLFLAETALHRNFRERVSWLTAVDEFVPGLAWDVVWASMKCRLADAARRKSSPSTLSWTAQARSADPWHIVCN